MALQAGVAYLDMVPDWSGFGRDLGRDVDRHMKPAGNSIRSHFSGLFGTIAKTGGLLLAGVGIKNFFQDSIAEAREAAKVGAETEQRIRTTGAAAWTSAGQVETLAGKLSNLVGVDDEVIQQGANLLLTFKNIRNEVGAGNDIFDRANELALDMSAAFKQDLSGSAIQLGKALDDPVRGITALRRVGVSFTEAQQDQIKALVEAGDVMGAQKLILAELEKQVGGTAKAVADPWQRFGVVAGNVKEQLGTALLPMLNSVGTFLADNLPRAVEWARQAFNRLVEFFSPIIDGVRSLFGGEGGGELGGALSDAGATIADTLVGWGKAFVEWVKPYIGPMLDALGDLLKALGEWIWNTALPWIGEHLVKWGKAFVEWVGPRIPPLLEELGKLLGALGTWLLEVGLPALLENLVKWGKAFVEWVAPQIPPLLLELGKLLGKLLLWVVTDAIPKIVASLLDMGLKAIGGLLEGFGKAMIDVFAWLYELPGRVFDALVALPGRLLDMGKKAMHELWEGFKDVWESIQKWFASLNIGRFSPLSGFFNVGGAGAANSDGWGVPSGGGNVRIAAPMPPFNGTADDIIALARRAGVTATATSIYRPGSITASGNRSYHGMGRAVDFVSPNLRALFNAFLPFARNLKELIYSGAPFNIKNGKQVPRYAVAQHWDHVHVALANGTVFDRPTTGLFSFAETARARPEIVSPAPLMAATFRDVLAEQRRGGPAVQFGDVYLAEEVDVDVVLRKAEFAVSAGRFG